MATRCSAQNREAGPCNAQAWRDGLCRWHHPSLADERETWRRRGGASRSNKRRAQRDLAGELMTLKDVQAVLCRALRKVEAGELDSGPANAMSSLARAIAAVAQAGDLEDRLQVLEAAAAAHDRRWTG